ncbi:HAD-IIA family hydrolase [Gallaecimonas kandeliae]|uniref:HAD-IIA family hydrolase n=1 Tax=Gallaecimonas kandeliae TaxID=3029055 RepID=UPI00264737BF|nr:HAD-IIA family hydrolase [Gallaecimonas kandeliae]WKE64232.1 HAD-IIA family hydrolase [Gallaecimonas kandeliae]
MVKGILCDLDGVVYLQERPLPGALDAIQALGELPLAFLTNTTSRSPQGLAELLGRLGLIVAPEQVLTPISLATLELHKRGISRIWPLVEPEALAAFAGFELSDARPQALVLGDIGARWDYELLNRLFNLLKSQPELPIISLGLSTFYQGPAGLKLDVGPFSKLLSGATGAELVVCGKPDPRAFVLGAELLGLAPSEVAMVGDDIHSDVAAAQQAGLKGLLVKTGKFRPEQLGGEVVPDAVLDNLAALPAWLQRH